MTNHAVYPKLIILSYWNTPSWVRFCILSRGAEKDAHDFIIKMLFDQREKSYIRYLFTIHYYLLLPNPRGFSEK